MNNYEIINLVLLLFITLLEFVAFGWLIIQMKKSATEREKILRLEESHIAMERRILKALDINQLVSTPDLIDFLDHISVEGDGDVNLEEVDIDSFPESMRKKPLGDITSFENIIASLHNSPVWMESKFLTPVVLTAISDMTTLALLVNLFLI